MSAPAAAARRTADASLRGRYLLDREGVLGPLMLLPAVIFVALVQRQLMAGLTSGAVKG